jgi:hypothetical protein
MLINHNQGVVDPTVKPNHTVNNAAITVFLLIQLLPRSVSIGVASLSADIFLIFIPR